ncbi:Glycosyltransferase involved in cell wall bisynthesis [Anaerovirgula multivorans]|uniref:Glycosyltransferase involved in cell wall bisynthesis n=1 Tax=Anaerovirgula multivorans TaxID=312168 RepID=A0A238ZQP3_9FIRM|nr:glycosyltransferase [Anaerovirgula multivorans]SNR85361.1 Glycosyltransferase involved in cell wall bisynthesis [Anaerovirgula multivorans]
MSFTNPKVVHVPLEIAGQVGLICEFLREAGYKAFGFNYFDNYLKYESIFQTEAYELIKVLEKFIDHYDIFHFHNGYSVMEDYRDICMIKKAGKKMIMHHRGNDVRFETLARKGKNYINPYVNTANYLSDEVISRNLKFFAETMDAAIVQDYELYQYVIDYYQERGKPVYVLPRLINNKIIQPFYPKTDAKSPIIVHAPTHRGFKGSDIIEATINRLKQEKSLVYINIEGKSHKEALKCYQQADIVIDQILCGAYGNVSVEAMALGKAVICYIRPDLMKMYPDDLPIVSANPDNLYDQLKKLVEDSEKRHEIGKEGRRYVEKYHEGSKVIKQLISIYENLLRG